jgi:hypothetical protein
VLLLSLDDSNLSRRCSRIVNLVAAAVMVAGGIGEIFSFTFKSAILGAYIILFGACKSRTAHASSFKRLNITDQLLELQARLSLVQFRPASAQLQQTVRS